MKKNNLNSAHLTLIDSAQESSRPLPEGFSDASLPSSAVFTQLGQAKIETLMTHEQMWQSDQEHLEGVESLSMRLLSVAPEDLAREYYCAAKDFD